MIQRLHYAIDYNRLRWFFDNPILYEGDDCVEHVEQQVVCDGYDEYAEYDSEETWIQ